MAFAMEFAASKSNAYPCKENDDIPKHMSFDENVNRVRRATEGERSQENLSLKLRIKDLWSINNSTSY